MSLQLACFNCEKPLRDGIFCDMNCRAEYGRKQLGMQRTDEHEANWRTQYPKITRPKASSPIVLLPRRRCPCGVEFQPRRKDQTACSHKHYVQYWFSEKRSEKRRLNPKFCAQCGNVIGPYYRKYCSKLCSRRGYMENIFRDPVKHEAYKKYHREWGHKE